MPKKKNQPASKKRTRKQKAKKTAWSHNWQQVNEYFNCFGREGTAADLWVVLKLALGNDKDETTGSQRSNMIFLYENLKDMAEQVWQLLQQQKKLKVHKKVVSHPTIDH